MTLYDEITFHINLALFPLEAIPLEGFTEGGTLHSDVCRQVGIYTAKTAVTTTFGAYADNLCLHCWRDIIVAGGRMVDLGGLFDQLADTSKSVSEIQSMTLGSFAACLTVFNSVNEVIDNDWMLKSSPLEESVGAKWRQTFLEAVKGITSQARSELTGTFKSELLHAFVKELLMTLPDKALLPESHQIAADYNAKQLEALSNLTPTHLAQLQRNWSAPPFTSLILGLWGTPGSDIALVPRAVVAYLTRHSSSGSIVELPEGLDSESINAALETIRVLHQPNGDKDAPYSNFRIAAQAAFKL